MRYGIAILALLLASVVMPVSAAHAAGCCRAIIHKHQDKMQAHCSKIKSKHAANGGHHLFHHGQNCQCCQ
ncbi:MAG TPA: hypothetical protein VIK18_19840 [Pirellulales bacterium]